MKDLHDILKIRTNNVKPAKGKILISEPFLFDYFFKRSVVLLAEHNKDGTFGVIVNKPVRAKFNEVVKDFPKFDAPVFLGGPVQSDSLFFIHTMGEQIDGSLEIIKGVYWGGDIELVKELIKINYIKPEEIRFYVGYSGWAPKQLDGELERNSWVVTNLDAKQLMGIQPSQMWSRVLRKLGGDYSYWPNYPDDPTLN